MTSSSRRNRITAAILATVMLFGGAVTSAAADDLADLEKKLRNARSQADQNKSALDDVLGDLEHSDKELTEAYEKLETTRAQIPVAEAELAKADGEYEVAQREATTIAERLEDAREERSEIAAQIEKNEQDAARAQQGIAQMARDYARGNYRFTSIELLVGASDFSEVMADYNLSQTAMRTEADALQSVREAQAVATNMQVRLEAAEETIATLQVQAQQNVETTKLAQQQATDAKNRLDRLAADQSAAAAKIESRRQAELTRQQELKDESSELSDEIQKLIGLTKAERRRLKKEREKAEREARQRAEAQRKAQANNGSGNSGSSGSGSSGPPSSSGSGKFLGYPVSNPYITSHYGMRFHPVLHYWRLHAGTDFRAYCGAAIYASGSGTVQWAKYRSGWGNQVMINHGTVSGSNLMTSYNHLSRFAVSSGAKVKKGDLVGYSGATGTVTACHLHFEVYVNGNTVDPMSRL